MFTRISISPVAVLLALCACASSPLNGQEPEPVQKQIDVPSWNAELYRTYMFEPWMVGASGVALIGQANMLGAEVGGLEDVLRSQLNVDQGIGVVVTSITAESEAAKAGLLQHDIVLNVDQNPVNSVEKFNELVTNNAGKNVVLELRRQGKPLTLEVTIPNHPQYQLASAALLSNLSNQFRIGVSLSNADDTLRSQLKLAAGEGLVVTEVIADGPAAKAGVKQHDVLIKLNDKRLTTVEDLNGQIQEVKDTAAKLVLLRGGTEVSLEVTPQLSQAALNLSNVNVFPMVYSLENKDLSSTLTLTQPVQSNGILWLNAAKAYQLAVNLDQQTTDAGPSPAAQTAAEQFEALKKQLAAMQEQLAATQKSLEQLQQTLK